MIRNLLISALFWAAPAIVPNNELLIRYLMAMGHLATASSYSLFVSPPFAILP